MTEISVQEQLEKVESLLSDIRKKVGAEEEERAQKHYCIPLSVAIERFRISHHTFYKWHKEGFITLLKLGGKTFVNLEEIYNNMQPLGRDLIKDEVSRNIEQQSNKL